MVLTQPLVVLHPDRRRRDEAVRRLRGGRSRRVGQILFALILHRLLRVLLVLVLVRLLCTWEPEPKKQKQTSSLARTLSCVVHLCTHRKPPVSRANRTLVSLSPFASSLACNARLLSNGMSVRQSETPAKNLINMSARGCWLLY